MVLVYPSALPPGAPCDLSHRPAVYLGRENIRTAPAVSHETIVEDEEPAA